MADTANKLKNYPGILKRYYFRKVKEISSIREGYTYCVRRGDFVLDTGCGKKSFIKRWQPNVRLVVGIDIWEDSIRQNKDTDLPVVGDIENLPFKDSIFDFVLSDSVVEHMYHPAQVFREFHRVMKKGGRILLITNSIYSPMMSVNKILPLKFRQWVKDSILGIKGYAADTFPAPYRCNSVCKMTRVMKRIGFEKLGIWCFGGIYTTSFTIFLIFLLCETITDLKWLQFAKLSFAACYKKI